MIFLHFNDKYVHTCVISDRSLQRGGGEAEVDAREVHLDGGRQGRVCQETQREQGRPTQGKIQQDQNVSSRCLAESSKSAKSQICPEWL